MGKKLNLGGQAVMEGVMIRSLKHYVVAVRKSKRFSSEIIIKKGRIKQRKSKFCKFPVVRGFFNLVDMLSIGMKSMLWSAEQQTGDGKISKLELILTISISMVLAILFFIAMPYFLTLIIGFKEENQPFLFNLIDGIIRITIFFIYIIAISFIKDVKILFQYHGAEHKAVHCYEHNKKLNIGNIKKFSTLHPRCGTSFIIIVLLISILVFSILPPIVIYLFPNFISLNAFLRKTILFLLRISLVPLIAGISYEFLKFSAKYQQSLAVRLLSMPGLFLQKITTKEPTKRQIGVAIAAMEKFKNLH